MVKLTLLLILMPALLFAQSYESVDKRLGPHPIKFLDSVKINDEQFSKINATDIAILTIITDTDAVKAYGIDAKDGVIICETKSFARKHYVAFLCEKSLRYNSLYTASKNDSTFLYILNDKPKIYNYEGDLALIKDDHFISLEILNGDELKKKYGIEGKSYGISVHYSKP